MFAGNIGVGEAKTGAFPFRSGGGLKGLRWSGGETDPAHEDLKTSKFSTGFTEEALAQEILDLREGMPESSSMTRKLLIPTSTIICIGKARVSSV